LPRATPNKLFTEIRARIKDAADPKRAAFDQTYFKEKIKSHGLSVPAAGAIAKEVFRREKDALDGDEWLALGERLLASGWMDEGNVGFGLVRMSKPEPTAELFDTYERWLRSYVGNWAHCDELSTHLIGDVLFAQPKLVRRLYPWTKDENRWVRRSSAVSLVRPARRGLYVNEALRVAGALVDDKDDMVQKGYGWMLREAAKTHMPEVTAFLEKHARRMGRTAFRYAIEKHSPAERKRLMGL
jgi:3-methyladenine DNA glycosylase AlkD